MIELSKATRKRIRVLHSQNDWSTIEDLLLRECGDNLPFVEPTSKRLAERIRFAVLKLADGDPAKLRHEVRAAQVDWRDTLMAAGFGHDASAHKKWKPRSRPAS